MLRPTIVLVSVLAAVPASAQAPPRFNRDVRPILSDRCFACHGPDAAHRKADLRLDTAAGAASVIEPGAPDLSELWLRVTHADPGERMPPAASTGKQLSDQELATLRQWIEDGAVYEAHWSFAPPRRPTVPDVEDPSWPRNPVDRFVAARLDEERLAPSPDADPTTLVRRVFLDLTGLPPTRADVDDYLRDTDDGRLERLVDRLLDTPHFAERMAVWWLDLVRYADTVGYHGDQEQAAEPYRDYVLKAFRDDDPFDRFTREQLAGDLLPDRTDEQWIASAYNRLLQTTHEGGLQPGEYLAKYAADRVRNVSEVWLGATMGCAECHDHKFDPYTQRDFYRMAAFFADIDEVKGFGAPNTTPTRRPPEVDLPGPFADQVEPRRVMVSVAVEPRPVRVLARGNWMDDHGELVEPGVPAVLTPLTGIDGERATRLDLARWLTSPGHPQTARVVANRIWAMFFGRGLSASLDDNGSQGAWPSHPELLDWLAVEFVDSGWNLRHLVRTVVTSRAYRQASIPRTDLRERDPQNVLLARQGRWRLPAEFVRDTALAVSGLLVDRLGGAKSRPYQPPGYYAHLNFPPRKYAADPGELQYRRGVYVHWQRMFLHPMLRAFDAPTREECTAQRAQSNTPLQALTLLNDPTFVEAARVFAARVLDEGGAEDRARIEWAWRQALVRAPTAAEVDVLVALLRSHRAAYEDDEAAAVAVLDIGLASVSDVVDRCELAAWTSVTRAIFNLHEAITRS